MSVVITLLALVLFIRFESCHTDTKKRMTWRGGGGGRQVLRGRASRKGARRRAKMDQDDGQAGSLGPILSPARGVSAACCTDCSMRRKTRMYESCATKDEKEASFQEKHPTDDPPSAMTYEIGTTTVAYESSSS